MEKIELNYPATDGQEKPALAGVVGSGDLEVLFKPETSRQLSITIRTSVDGSSLRWRRLFDRIATARSLPSGQLTVHDFGATPGVARLRIEQVFEEADHA